MALAAHSGELGSMPGRTAKSGDAMVLFFAGVMFGVSFACAAERWNSSCALERRISCRSGGQGALSIEAGRFGDHLGELLPAAGRVRSAGNIV